MNSINCRIKSYIQPFERELAIRELKKIAGALPIPISTDGVGEYYSIETNSAEDYLRRNLAYWDLVQQVPTVQASREVTVNFVRNGIPNDEIGIQIPLSDVNILPNRRVLRYGPHGLHEYRGKFFPQLVRALINIGGVTESGIVADPMVGSGTTIVEARLAGHNGIGLDTNPLSVFISNTKAGILAVNPDELKTQYIELRDQILSLRPKDTICVENLPYFSSFTKPDQEYLLRWFSERILCDLDQVMQIIVRVENEQIRNLFIVGVSNILRSVSWQKMADLRVRKENKIDEDLDPYRSFLEDIGRSVRYVLAFLYENRGRSLGSYNVQECSALKLSTCWNKYLDRVDVVITSPPYATALPYLDTDRLSLIYLGLLSRPEHYKRNLEMIGNREVSERIRQELWKKYLEKKSELPSCVTDLIDSLDHMNTLGDVGFRRRNLPALLGKYFLDMHQVFKGIFSILKPGASAFVVVGNNHTFAGGNRVDINTSRFLEEIANLVGFHSGEIIPMEMLISRDIFRNNAVASEYILTLEKG